MVCFPYNPCIIVAPLGAKNPKLESFRPLPVFGAPQVQSSSHQALHRACQKSWDQGPAACGLIKGPGMKICQYVFPSASSIVGPEPSSHCLGSYTIYNSCQPYKHPLTPIISLRKPYKALQKAKNHHMSFDRHTIKASYYEPHRRDQGLHPQAQALRLCYATPREPPGRRWTGAWQASGRARSKGEAQLLLRLIWKYWWLPSSASPT